MGCGASKGTDTLGSPAIAIPQASSPEFTPESKPRPATDSDDLAKAKESRDTAAKRVDAIVKNGVSDFEDDTDATLLRPLTAEEPAAQLLPDTVVPPPPVTPPAAAKKPLFQIADTGNLGENSVEDVGETPYFPKQVALNIGGGGYRPQQQLPASQTSLQPFDATRPPPLSEPVPPLAGFASAPTAPTLVPSASSRQLQPLPQQRLPQLQALQQQPSAHVLATPVQGQPLTESGPGPASTSFPSTQAPASTAATDDPWSSLQSTYRIRESQAAAKSESTRSRAAIGSRDTGGEVLVLGEDDDDFGSSGGALNATAKSAAMNRTSGFGGRPPISLPPPQFGSGPKKGGWGSGAMAQAGELMIGEDDWLVKDRPPGSSSAVGMQLPPVALHRQQQQQQQQTVMSYNSRAKLTAEEEERHAPVTLKGPSPAPKAKGAEDVLCEDVEDVDMLLEDEMERQGLSNKSLASKLAAYEAQFKADDDD